VLNLELLQLIFFFKLGNSLSSATQDRHILDKAKYLMRNNMAASIEAVQQLDDIIFQLAVRTEYYKNEFIKLLKDRYL
jgi:hypothetical protein